MEGEDAGWGWVFDGGGYWVGGGVSFLGVGITVSYNSFSLFFFFGYLLKQWLGARVMLAQRACAI